MDITPTRLVTGAIAIVIGLMLYRSLHPSTSFAADGTDRYWDSAVQASRDSGKPTIVLFTADWCPACQALHRELAAPAAQAELDHYYVYKVNLTNPTQAAAEHARQFGARYIPLMIRYDTDQKETARTNWLSEEDLIQWLKAGE